MVIKNEAIRLFFVMTALILVAMLTQPLGMQASLPQSSLQAPVKFRQVRPEKSRLVVFLEKTFEKKTDKKKRRRT